MDVLPKYFTAYGAAVFESAFKNTISSGEVVRFELWVDFTLFGTPGYYSFELRRAGTDLKNRTNIMSGVLVVMVDLTDFMREKQRQV